MAGIDEYMEFCGEEDEDSWYRELLAEREMAKQSAQILYEAEVRRGNSLYGWHRGVKQDNGS